jgi:bifunctional enzyme CysN/CysC
MEHLETVAIDADADRAKPFRMPVQWVNRPNLDFRGFSGLIASGTIKPGDAIRVLPSAQDNRPSRASSRWTAISTRASPASR